MAVNVKEPEENIPYILVKDSLKALRDAAKAYRLLSNIPIIGITGSVGKTSTKELTASVLSQGYSVLKTEGNLNNEIGLPEMVLRIRPEHEIAVLEMGINHFGEMERLLHEAEVRILETSVFGRARKFLDLVTDNPDYQKELTRHLKKLQALFGKRNFNENAAEPYAKFIDAMNAPTTGAKISAIQELLNFFSADFIGAGLFDGELIHSTNEPVETEATATAS